MKLKLAAALTLLTAAGSLWASPHRSFSVEVPLSVHGPERINLERVFERRRGIDLDRFEVRSVTLIGQRTRRHGEGRAFGAARLIVDDRRSQLVSFNRRLQAYHLSPPQRRGEDWRLRVGNGAFVDTVVVELRPRRHGRRVAFDDRYRYDRGVYRNHGYWLGAGFYWDSHRRQWCPPVNGRRFIGYTNGFDQDDNYRSRPGRDRDRTWENRERDDDDRGAERRREGRDRDYDRKVKTVTKTYSNGETVTFRKVSVARHRDD